MLIVKIVNRETKEIIEIPASDLQSYCKERNWEYNIIKQYFNRNVHYANRNFLLCEKEEVVIEQEINKDLEINHKALESELLKEEPKPKKSRSKKE